MKVPIFIATLDKDIYVEEIIIASELGNGTNAVYNPKKLRLFVWEGETIGTDCENECSSEGTVFDCSDDLTQVLERTCGDFDTDYCLEWETECTFFEDDSCLEYGDEIEIEVTECDEGEECVEELGVCVEPSKFFNLTCRKQVITATGCVWNYGDECDAYDGGRDTGNCPCSNLPWPFDDVEVCDDDDEYECWNYEYLTTKCSEDPVCPAGSTEIAKNSCSAPEDECEDICSPAGPIYSCSADDAKVLVRNCEDSDGDGCLEWDDIKVDYACGVKKQCEEGNSVCVITS